jgi:hypothetical protein
MKRAVSVAEWKMRWSRKPKTSSEKMMKGITPSAPDPELLPLELLTDFEMLQGNDYTRADPWAIARYTHKLTGWEWYPTFYFPQQKLFYGFINKYETYGMGFFFLEELQQIYTFGFAVELDEEFRMRRLREVVEYVEASVES